MEKYHKYLSVTDLYQIILLNNVLKLLDKYTVCFTLGLLFNSEEN